jgi:hypothetical protein
MICVKVSWRIFFLSISDWRAKGKTDKELKRMNTTVRRNKRMMKPHDISAAEIYWSADDTSDYKFEVTPREKRQPASETEAKKEEVDASEKPPGVTHSVASYFLTRYNYALKYPKMPIVYTREGMLGDGGVLVYRSCLTYDWLTHIRCYYTREGYYPVEFLTQAQERKRGVDALDHGLKFNDNFSGTARVEHVQRIKNLASSIEKNGINLNAIMKQFNLTVSDEPEKFEASILRAPKLKFAGNNDARIQNGSWNLRNVRFERYACMPW